MWTGKEGGSDFCLNTLNNPYFKKEPPHSHILTQPTFKEDKEFLHKTSHKSLPNRELTSVISFHVTWNACDFIAFFSFALYIIGWPMLVAILLMRWRRWCSWWWWWSISANQMKKYCKKRWWKIINRNFAFLCWNMFYDLPSDQLD